MRSIVLAIAFAASMSAVAATPYNFTKPTTPHQARAEKEQSVFLTIVNHVPNDREVLVGDQMYKIDFGGVLHVYAPVGSTVRLYSRTQSKINGQQLLQVTPEDANRSLLLN
jgi:hypothetical protein